MPRIKKCLLGWAVFCLVVLVGGWGWLHLTIQADVEEFAAAAQQRFPRPGDDIGSLVAYFQSGTETLRERNLAVWALGQLRGPRALPALKAAYTGEACNHATFLCQRELSKAIELCRTGSPNILFIHARRTPRQ